MIPMAAEVFKVLSQKTCDQMRENLGQEGFASWMQDPDAQRQMDDFTMLLVAALVEKKWVKGDS